ncbi:MAG: hypothetical protein ACLP0J_10225 [Solirubrobacteraceae bacterium]
MAGARAVRQPHHLGRAAALGRRHPEALHAARAINIKRARFGSLKNVFEVDDYCAAIDIAMCVAG